MFIVTVKMKFASAVILTSALFIWSLQKTSAASEDAYQPECESLSEAIGKIQDSLSQFQEWGISASINCSRNTVCDGFSCVLTLENQRTEVSVKLLPCENPPQMFVLVQDPDTNLPYIEETVTHGDTYDIPGLQADYLQFIRLSVAIGVQFEKVSGGFQIGLNLEFISDSIGSLFTVPLLPPTVIHTPDCPTPGSDLQCVKMQQLVTSLVPAYDFNCTMNEDCKGFTCSGSIPTPYVDIPITAIGILDSCTNPISYTIIIQEVHGVTVWSHSFIRSDSVFVEGDNVRLPPGVTANLNVTMEPYTMDIDYLISTIQLTLCSGPVCRADKFIDRGLVPIPPCDHPLTTVLPGPTAASIPLTGSGNECLTMHAIATDISNNPLFADDQMMCHANGPCDGFTCDLNARGRNFDISVKLFHCETPVRILFRIDDDEEGPYEYHLAKNITHNDCISIDGFVPNGTVKFFLMKTSSVSIDLAVTLELPNRYGDIVHVPLVQDRTITVAPCPTSMPAPTGSSVSVPVPSKTTYKPVAGTTKPLPVTTPGSNTQKPVKPPNGGGGNKGKTTDRQTSGVSIGVGIGVVAVVAAVVIVLAIIWYRRRSHIPSDHLTLVENASAPI